LNVGIETLVIATAYASRVRASAREDVWSLIVGEPAGAGLADSQF
jgi:hypothetical protein